MSHVTSPTGALYCAVQLMNEDLGLDSEHRWEADVAHFHRFVHQLAARGVHGVNIHFTSQLSVCARNTAAVEFEYYLRCSTSLLLSIYVCMHALQSKFPPCCLRVFKFSSVFPTIGGYSTQCRIEDLAQWFPCWDEGLGLSEYTKDGWAVMPHGKVYVGAAGSRRKRQSSFERVGRNRGTARSSCL